MILSDVSSQNLNQKITISCDRCKILWKISLFAQKEGIKNYGLDLCRGCKQREQIKKGIRGKQYINAGISSIKKMKGKTFEELYGKEKAKKMKELCSINTSGKNNPNYGGSWRGINPSKINKGKTFEELYGKEKAKKIKNKISSKTSGKNNPMYGKPSPVGSGNGWSGWYKGWYFRSLKELSYMINVIERFKLKWESGEQKKFKIEYIDWKGTNKTYHPDFLIEEKYLVEIKPKNLWNSDTIKRKRESAKIWCEKRGLKYKIIECTKPLSFEDIKILIKDNKISFTKRYQEKFKLWEN
jgi:hypothetical protein